MNHVMERFGEWLKTQPQFTCNSSKFVEFLDSFEGYRLVKDEDNNRLDLLSRLSCDDSARILVVEQGVKQLEKRTAALEEWAEHEGKGPTYRFLREGLTETILAVNKEAHKNDD